MSEQYTTLGQSTLNGGINNSVTTLTVTSASSFPSSGVFRVRVEDEIMKVTGVSGSDFTVVRGQEGTSPASHADGKAIYEVVTAVMLDEVRKDIAETGLYGSLPAYGTRKLGDIYLPNDNSGNSRGSVIHIRGASGWFNAGPLHYLIKPVKTDYSTVHGSATQENDGVVVTPADLRWFCTKSIPISAPYRLEVGCIETLGIANFNYVTRLLVRDSVSGKVVWWGFERNNGVKFIVAWLNGDLTWNSNKKSVEYQEQPPFGAVIFFAIRDDGTNFHFEYSVNGEDWLEFYTEANDAWTTPDLFGIAADTSDGGRTSGMKWVHVRAYSLA